MSYYQQIYDRLRKAGFTEAGALGVLGNWECESNCEPGRLQGDYNSFRTVSRQYVWDVSHGMISRQRFGSDQKGFGLAQWTYVNYPYNTKGRKFDLYDYWKQSGLALDSVEMQVNFALKEFKESFSSDLAFLKSTNDIKAAVETVCAHFENPKVHNVTDRYNAALRIMKMIDLDGSSEPEPQPTPTPQPSEDHKLELRTIDKNCSGFPEVYLAKSLLINRGYDSVNGGLLAVDDIWTDALTKAVVQFQRDFGLDADGAIGPKTWAKLMERG